MKKIALTVILTVLACGLVFAGGKSEAKTTTTNAKTVSTVVVKEAPELAAKVAAGELPPLEQRIPDANNVLVSNMESTGTYGGNMKFVSNGSGSRWTIGKLMEEPMFRFKLDGTIEPNVAKDYSISDDCRVYTIYLRKGMKWSDGVPFTADDVVFYYNDMCLTKWFGKSLYDCFYSTNTETGVKTPCTVEKVDDYTVRVTFVDPNVTFLESLSNDSKWFFAPKHFIEPLMADSDASAKALGYSDAKAMGKAYGYYYWEIPGRPTLRPWVADNDINSELHTYSRNPYYWKVDDEGKQLPYVNQLQFFKIADAEQSKLRALAGDVDFAAMGLGDYALLKANAEKGGYELYTWATTSWATKATVVHFNQTIKDLRYREIFQKKEFREAMSISVDREEVSELITDGFGAPSQSAVPEGLLGYSSEWTNKWTEYDPAKANKLLDSIGLSKKDKNGYRTFADGSEFVINIQVTDIDDVSTTEKMAELLAKYWGAVGIKTTEKVYARDLMTEICNANDHEVLLGPLNAINASNPILRPNGIIPLGIYSAWAGAYGEYTATNGASGVKPEGDVAKLIELYNKAKVSPDYVPYAKEILKLHQENIWEIAYCAASPTLIIKNAKLQNIGSNLIFCEEFRDLGIAHIENAYFKN